MKKQKILCRLGLHRLKMTGKTFLSSLARDTVLEYRCTECGVYRWRKRGDR